MNYYNVYIIPMINVDGVVIGNSTSNLDGIHLENSWKFQANHNS